MTSEQQIESELIAGMRRLVAPYQTAIKILRDEDDHRTASDTENQDVQESSGDTDICERLKPCMEVIAECENTIHPLRTAWNGLRKSAEGELQQLVNEQSALLQELIALLNRLEGRIVSSRSRVGRQLDESQQRKAMREAYRG